MAWKGYEVMGTGTVRIQLRCTDASGAVRDIWYADVTVVE